MNEHREPDTTVLVVGAGISGICAGIKLRDHGFEDFVILERDREVGGTWYQQTYPGLTVDVPALLYSYSFAQKPDWSSMWATQPEMLAYLCQCVEKYGVRQHLRFGEEVVSATYDAEDNLWVVQTAGGNTYLSRYLINASGFLSTSAWPEIDGIDDFAGLKLHTSQWSDDLDLAGKRIAMIGTGATAIQLAPELAERATSMHVFQRTPIWLLPKPTLRFPRLLKKLFARAPISLKASRALTSAIFDLLLYPVFVNYPRRRWLVRQVERIGRLHVRRQVRDRELQQKLTPNYTWCCKRPSFSQDYFRMFDTGSAELVTTPISRITTRGIATTDGVERPVDVLICATGYQPFARDTLPTYPVYGREGEDIRAYWDAHRYQAFHGMAVHGFPNFFLIYGPYSVLSGSYFSMVELTVHNIMTCLTTARAQGADYVEVKRASQEADFANTLHKMKSSMWMQGNCASSNTYYIDRHGDTPSFRPTIHPREWWFSRHSSIQHYDIRRVGRDSADERRLPTSAAPA